MRSLVLLLAATCCAASPMMQMPSSSMDLPAALGNLMQHPMAQDLSSATDPFSVYNRDVVRLPKPGKDFSVAKFLKALAENTGTDSFTPMIPVIEAASATMDSALTMVTTAEQPQVALKSTEPTMDKPLQEVRSHTQSAVSQSAVRQPTVSPQSSTPEVGLLPFGGDRFHAQDQAGRFTFSYKGNPSSQFQARDLDGRYAFGHWGGPTAQFEARDSVRGTAGLYSYSNPEGQIDMRMYVANNDDGFRVAASDLPIDDPDVADLKAQNAYEHAMRTLPVIPAVGAEDEVYKAIL